MLIVYAALFVTALVGCKFAGRRFLAEESFSRPTTDSIKGIFIWLVFLSHFAGYVTYTAPIDKMGYSISRFLGQLIVACFLFYSGYGVCEAIKKRGSDYVGSFPKHRIGKTLLHFDLAVLLFLILGLLQGKRFGIFTVLLSFIGWESLGNSNWYIFDVLVLYALTFLAFRLIKNNLKHAVMLVTILSFVMVVILRYTRPSWWYDTVLCYALGMWVSVYKDTLIELVTKNNVRWGLCLLALVGLFFATYYMPPIRFYGPACDLLNPLIFCLFIVVLLFKLNISNKVLAWSGRYTFELYILQRIPMILFKSWGLADFNLYVYFACCLAATLLLAVIFRRLTEKLDKAIFG